LFAVAVESLFRYVLPDAWKARDVGWEQQSAHLEDFSTAPMVQMQGMAFEWNTFYTYQTETAYRIPQMVHGMESSDANSVV
tara:strand:- start:1774 stop:2016 length:243 start_codon:yes stop_codon:yes gene_type:complete